MKLTIAGIEIQLSADPKTPVVDPLYYRAEGAYYFISDCCFAAFSVRRAKPVCCLKRGYRAHRATLGKRCLLFAARSKATFVARQVRGHRSS